MIPVDELRAYQRRADAGMLRIADAQRLLMGLLPRRYRPHRLAARGARPAETAARQHAEGTATAAARRPRL